jgi:lipopolysaccharide/colanic/teichoic acid biosynthesis glycosyltransferase
MLKRAFDLLVSGTGLLILSPLFFLVGIVIKLDSNGAIFFRQERVGKRGKTFLIHKFRTMHEVGSAIGPLLTVGADPRITRVGVFLRRYKVDEMPQLIDVFLGRMSMVGPRPEVPKYISYYPVDVRSVVLSVKPGISDWASIRFRDESSMLAQSIDPEKDYIEKILPIKIQYYVDYVGRQSFFGDIKIIAATILAVLKLAK